MDVARAVVEAFQNEVLAAKPRGLDRERDARRQFSVRRMNEMPSHDRAFVPGIRVRFASAAAMVTSDGFGRADDALIVGYRASE